MSYISTQNKDQHFRVWDGEGKNFPDGTHRLTLLSNTDGEYISNEQGLSTIECFQFLFRERTKAKDVWFSFGYDVNKILHNIPLRGKLNSLLQLWKFNFTWFGGYKIKYIPRKFFSVSYGKDHFRSTDIFSFFQCSFLKACEQWGILVSDVIKQGKADRNIFDTYTPEQVLMYNLEELQDAGELIRRLYYAFKEIELVPSSWHGPGALAHTFFKKFGIKKHSVEAPFEMQIPIRHAYFGGRIDISGLGEYWLNRYDISSAYPYALTGCISLEFCSWNYNPYARVNDEHALYHIKWNVGKCKWGPFPWRKKNNIVMFPTSGEGWYWGCEVLAAERLFGKDKIQRLGAWYPFVIKKYPFKDAIEKLFKMREKVGKKTGAGIAIKLVLNSLYGKLCQSKGGKTWQNYIWAGWITAKTRSMMLDVIKEIGEDNVVVIATDGIYTKKPIYGLRTKGLGSWEYEGFNQMLIVGAGLYTIFKEDGTSYIEKQRGLPSNLNHGWILREWGCTTKLNGKGEDSFKSKFTTFIGMGKALSQDKPFGVFLEEERQLQNVLIVGTSKRFPPVFYWQDIPWLQIDLQPRERPPNSPMLSAPYNKDREIIEELRVEEECDV